MAGWGEFTAAMALFFASHLIPARPRVRAALRQRLGRAGYGAVYGLVAVAVLAWVIGAAGRAPMVVLWDQAVWQRWVVNGAMGAAVLLAAVAVGAVNPFSFGGRAKGFDPARPGIAGFARHPLLLALLFWALAHLLVNGDLAHALVFGPFAAFAALGMVAIDARHQRAWGAAEWARLSANTALLSLAALRFGRVSGAVLARFGIGLAVWGALLVLHPWVIGVSPLP
ncbi:MAG: NnrU family protein [Pseudorhodobacter sp.]|nr:NnrU family protein [Pseudorhodobacter sp.]